MPSAVIGRVDAASGCSNSHTSLAVVMSHMKTRLNRSSTITRLASAVKSMTNVWRLPWNSRVLTTFPSVRSNRVNTAAVFQSDEPTASRLPSGRNRTTRGRWPSASARWRTGRPVATSNTSTPRLFALATSLPSGEKATGPPVG